MSNPLYRTFVCLTFAGILAASPAPVRADELDGGRLGPVHIVRSAVPPRHVVILFTDAEGWRDDYHDSAKAIAESGETVGVVDTKAYLARLDARASGCHSIASDLVELGRRLAALQPPQSQEPPVLAGQETGAMLAYLGLAQSAPGDFSRAIGFDFTADVSGQIPLCPESDATAIAEGFRYAPLTSLPAPWRLATDDPEDALARAFTKAANARLITVRGYDDLASSVIAVLAEDAPPMTASDVSSLPLVPLPVAKPAGSVMALVWSGDGGWRDIDKELGGLLVDRGIPVVGVDTLRFFWNSKTPEQVAAALNAIIDHYGHLWNTPDVLLIGFSLGADVLPFAINRLPAATRSQIRQVSLLSPSQAADFKVHISGWFGVGPSKDAVPLDPEFTKLDRRLVQCFYGADERDDSGCRLPSLAQGVEIEELAGGHHFDGDYTAVLDRILTGLKQRMVLTATAGRDG